MKYNHARKIDNQITTVQRNPTKANQSTVMYLLASSGFVIKYIHVVNKLLYDMVTVRVIS